MNVNRTGLIGGISAQVAIRTATAKETNTRGQCKPNFTMKCTKNKHFATGCIGICHMNNTFRVCNYCEKEYPLNHKYFISDNTDNKFGLNNTCIKCIKLTSWEEGYNTPAKGRTQMKNNDDTDRIPKENTHKANRYNKVKTIAKDWVESTSHDLLIKYASERYEDYLTTLGDQELDEFYQPAIRRLHTRLLDELPDFRF